MQNRTYTVRLWNRGRGHRTSVCRLFESREDLVVCSLESKEQGEGLRGRTPPGPEWLLQGATMERDGISCNRRRQARTLIRYGRLRGRRSGAAYGCPGKSTRRIVHPARGGGEES